MPRDPSETLSRQAAFVFVGKVQKLKAANVRAVEDKTRTVIVQVEEVEKAPPGMTGYAGQEITVKLAPGENVKPAERARFYTNGWLFGETIAVESIGHAAATPRTLAAHVPGPASNSEIENIENRVATADVVVQGRVVSVRLPQADRAATRTAATRTAATRTGEARRPITEHDPEWREALVEVAGVQKGALNKKQIVVRFPGSDDVRWHKAPKFQPGQEGLFILQRAARPKTGGRTRAAAMAPAIVGAADAFTALRPEDFQPLEREQEIRSLVKTAPRSRRQR
jgi:hypothetical protein